MTVDQSGQYFQLAFDNGPQGVAVNRVGRDADGRLSLARGKWRVTIDGPAGAEVRTFHVDGPQSGTLTARRPVPAADAPATRPATAPALTPAPKEAP